MEFNTETNCKKQLAWLQLGHRQSRKQSDSFCWRWLLSLLSRWLLSWCWRRKFQKLRLRQKRRNSSSKRLRLWSQLQTCCLKKLLKMITNMMKEGLHSQRSIIYTPRREKLCLRFSASRPQPAMKKDKRVQKFKKSPKKKASLAPDLLQACLLLLKLNLESCIKTYILKLGNWIKI